MTKSLVVLISGKQGSGKSTLAELLAHELYIRHSYCRGHLLNFADPLYEIHNYARGLLKQAGVAFDETKKDGKLLQLLGTEWGRQTIGPDTWVRIAQSRVQSILKNECRNSPDFQVFIVADCRFQNELFAFPRSLKVRLECGKELRQKRVSMWRDNDGHPSEVDLDESTLHFDLVIDSEKYGPLHAVELVVAQILKRRNETQI